MYGFYINLKKRIDRNIHIEKNILTNDIFQNIKRFNAIENNINPELGCGMSHLGALNELKKYNEIHKQPYYIIIEDDFMIFNIDNFNLFQTYFDKIKDYDKWDVIVLTPRGQKTDNDDPFMIENKFKRIIKNQTATAYIIKPYMINELINCFETACNNMTNKGGFNPYAIDQYWKELQNHRSFYYFTERFGGQLVGYSDIERRNIDYNPVFISHTFEKN
mgnify:CR=1 FL=1|tara:strand:- start:155 stop:811 length:657 start_codon:yes stop_codon:yes gene_type:complete